MKKQGATITIIVFSLFFMILASQLVLAGSGKIAFSKLIGDNFQIVVTDENGQNQINLSKNHTNDSNPVWSPDGKYIAFVSDRDRNPEIYIMNADGSDQCRITENPLDDLMPSFSPDGQRFTFTRMALQAFNTDPEIFLININGQDEKLLTDGIASDWSPDGKRIAFCKKDPGKANWNIYLMDTDGNNQINITNSPWMDTYPAWSPDGKQIVFSSNREKGYDNIFKMDSDGQNVVHLTQADENEIMPIWSPNGQYVAFTVLPINNSSRIEVIKADGGDSKVISDGGSPSWFDPAFARKYAVDSLSKISTLWGKLKSN